MAVGTAIASPDNHAAPVPSIGQPVQALAPWQSKAAPKSDFELGLGSEPGCSIDRGERKPVINGESQFRDANALRNRST